MEKIKDFQKELNELLLLKYEYDEIETYIQYLAVFDEHNMKVVAKDIRGSWVEGKAKLNVPIPITITTKIKTLLLNEYRKKKEEIDHKIDIFLQKK
jgi:hypothetical protein